jgi:type III protein arginine methyltransferase
MMAARAMSSIGGEKEGGQVSACESYLPMVKLMRRVLRANGMENKVKLFPRRSDELRVGCELDSRAHLMASIFFFSLSLPFFFFGLKRFIWLFTF